MKLISITDKINSRHIPLHSNWHQFADSRHNPLHVFADPDKGFYNFADHDSNPFFVIFGIKISKQNVLKVMMSRVCQLELRGFLSRED